MFHFIVHLLWLIVAQVFASVEIITPTMSCWTKFAVYFWVGWFALTLPSKWGRYLNCLLVIDLIAFIFAYPMVKLAKPAYGPINNDNGFAIEPRLPWWLSWFMTPDNSLWGDEGWQTKHCPYYNTTYGMVRWLWRNHGYGARWTTFAATVDREIYWEGDPGINRNTRAGILYCEMGDYWQWKWVKAIPGTKYCFMFNFGWLLDDYIDGNAGQPKALFQCSPRIATFKPQQ